MADGKVVIDTSLDNTGFIKGLKTLSGAASAGLAALAGYAVKVGASFEQGMSKVSAISGATGKDLEALTAKAEEMGIKTKFSATEATEAMTYMAMAGWKTEDMLNGVEGIMNLAAASGENLADVSDIVTDALTAFGLQAADSAHFSDVLAAASSNANTNVGLMGETFKYVAPVAGSLGYSVEDVSIAIGLMANSGLKGSQAGTALRSTLTRMVKPTKDSAAAMDALGLEISNADGTMKPFREVLLQLRKGFSELTDAEKSSYAAMLAGQEGMSGLLSIVNASEADFTKLAGAIDNADGSALNMAETMQDNLSGQMTLLGSSCEGLGLAIFNGIKAPLTEAAKYAIEAVNDITNSFKSGRLKSSIQSVGSLLGSLVKTTINLAKAVIPAFVKGLSFVADNMRTILPLAASLLAAWKSYQILTKIRGWLLQKVAASTANAAATAAETVAETANTAATSANAAATAANTTTLTANALATTALTAAKTALASAMSFLTSPIGILTVGVGALAAGLVVLCTSTDEETQALIEQKEAAIAARDAYEELQEEQAEQAETQLAEVSYTEAMLEKLLGLADAKGNIKAADAGLAKTIAEELNPALGETIRLNQDGTATITANTDALKQNIEQQKANIILESKLPAYKEAVTKSIELQKEQTRLYIELEAARQEQERIGMELEKARAEGNTANVHQLEQDYGKISQKVVTLGQTYEENEALMKEYYENISDYETTASDIKAGNYKKVLGIEKGTVDAAGKTTTDLYIEYQERAKDAKANYEILKQRAEEGWGNVTQEELDAAKKASEDADREFKKVGETFVNGLSSGATGAKTGFLNTIGDIVSAGITRAQREADSHSPSRKFAKVGKTFTQGLAVGAESERPAALYSMQNTVGELIQRARSTVQAQMSSRGSAFTPFVYQMIHSTGAINQNMQIHNRTSIELDGKVVAESSNKQNQIKRLVTGVS